VRRGLSGWLLCLCALALGISTAALSAANRARADQLDQLERWCEAETRRNELQRLENARDEWLLLGQGCSLDEGQGRGRGAPTP